MNQQIKQWLDNVAVVKHVNNTSDVHIDTLDARYKVRNTWISGAVELLIAANAYANAIGVRGVLSAAFPLAAADVFLGVDYNSIAELESEFDITPPSLYYFPENRAPWNDNEMVFQQVTVSDFPIDITAWTLLHLEYQEVNETEYRRSFWVFPRNSWNQKDGKGDRR
ncbi:MAG: hypothetical protein HZA46_07025 [Planctomycetales bacterium]|nr:hypothetical protein [Planctomycetales bacterium]